MKEACERDKQRYQTNKACQSVVHLHPLSICCKEPLGYLIIERWSNKLTITHRIKSFLAKGAINTKKKSQKWILFKECMLGA